MSTSWEYGDVSPARYPNPGQKRKSAKGSNPTRKKKKEKEENETLLIPSMTPIGLDAFTKNEATYLGEMPSDDDPTVEVVQEGVSYPQPNEKETQEAMQELMNELNGMVDQATQTPPEPTLDEMFHNKVKLVRVYDSPKDFAKAINSERKVNPPPPEDDNEGFKRMVRMATIFQSPPFQNPRPRARAVNYMVCPCLAVRLNLVVMEHGKTDSNPCKITVFYFTKAFPITKPWCNGFLKGKASWSWMI